MALKPIPLDLFLALMSLHHLLDSLVMSIAFTVIFSLLFYPGKNKFLYVGFFTLPVQTISVAAQVKGEIQP